MDDATSEPRTCDVCGKPLRSTNISGVCSSTPECRKERSRRDPRRAPGPKPDQCYCEICGKPIQRNNVTGICASGGTLACARERENRERRAKGIPARKRNKCDRPRCTRTKKRGGVCQMHWSRFERTGDYGPDDAIQIELTEVRAEETYGSWTVLEDGRGAVNKVPCRCACGTPRAVQISALTTGRSLSCGRKCEARRAADPYLLPGTYAQLEVLETGLRSVDMVRIHCNRCGRDTEKQAFLIKQGHSATCGCGKGKFTHGLSRHPLYGTWDGMLDRCTNPRATGYDGYGACGVTVCEGWQGAPDGFLNFVADMGERPDGMTLDRINVEGGYWCGRCPECIRLGNPANCRWATAGQQARNKRSVGKLAQQRNAALAEVERLNGLLTSRNRKPPTVPAIQDALF
jgi:hypothetical protein